MILVCILAYLYHELPKRWIFQKIVEFTVWFLAHCKIFGNLTYWFFCLNLYRYEIEYKMSFCYFE